MLRGIPSGTVKKFKPYVDDYGNTPRERRLLVQRGWCLKHRKKHKCKHNPAFTHIN